jgi:hypothetical protein
VSKTRDSRHEAEQPLPGLERPAPPPPSEGAGDDAAPDERTSPSPYAEKFDEWVADETGASDGQEHRSPARDAEG